MSRVKQEDMEQAVVEQLARVEMEKVAPDSVTDLDRLAKLEAAWRELLALLRRSRLQVVRG